MESGLAGKVALVTGGSAGIGYATARVLAEEGASVAFCARGADRLEAARAEIEERCPGARLLALPADVTSADSLRELHERTVDALGPVDILVNNAGTSRRGPFLEMTDAQWQEDSDSKVMAAVRLSRMCIPAMQARAWGRIINVTGVGGKTPRSVSTPTTVSRAAGIALTKALSKEFGPDNILVNAVCIGTVESDQHDRRWKASGSSLDRDAYYLKVAKGRQIPLGRAGRGHEAANVIAFLASELGSFVSGTAINVDGGQSAAT